MTYQHTQFSRIHFAGATTIYGLGILTFIPELANESWPLIPIAVILSLYLLTINFTALTVLIDSTHIRIKFGCGIFRKSFALKDIHSAKEERNPWWNGWGIRIWFFPFRRTYNVAGDQLVELKMKNGRIFRIGTDEPEKLLPAIQEAMKQWGK